MRQDGASEHYVRKLLMAKCTSKIKSQKSLFKEKIKFQPVNYSGYKVQVLNGINVDFGYELL